MTTERMYKSLIPFISFIGFPIILIATICGFSVDVLAEKKSDHLKVDISEYLREPIQKGMSPGLIAAIIDENGVKAIGAGGVRKYGSSEKLTVNDRVHIGSNTKAMTTTMLATLVEDGTFVDGWKTTIADVFPELLKKIHKDYHSVELSQLLRMKGGIAVNAKDWWAYSKRSSDIVKIRYAILRDNLRKRPAGRVGEFLYSNLSYMIAGAMAEKLMGKSWETLMEERLFTPLVYRPFISL